MPVISSFSDISVPTRKSGEGGAWGRTHSANCVERVTPPNRRCKLAEQVVMPGPACPIRGLRTTMAKYWAVSVLLTAAVILFVCAHFSAVERLVRRRAAVPVYSEAPVETWPDSPANLSWNKMNQSKQTGCHWAHLKLNKTHWMKNSLTLHINSCLLCCVSINLEIANRKDTKWKRVDGYLFCLQEVV